MTDAAAAGATEPESNTAQKSPLMSAKSFDAVLRALIGRAITIVTIESYEKAPMGAQLTQGFFRGKVVGVENDFVTIATEFAPKVKNAQPEPVRQFIPLNRVKRVSIMKSEILLHL